MYYILYFPPVFFTVSRARPFARRRASTRRPSPVFMRERKPCLRRRRRHLSFPCIAARGYRKRCFTVKDISQLFSISSLLAPGAPLLYTRCNLLFSCRYVFH